MEPKRLDLIETGDWQPTYLSSEHLRLLTASGWALIRPDPERRGWQVRAGSWVGAAIIGDPHGPQVDLRVQPKVPIDRLIFLLGYARSTSAWRNEVVDAPLASELPAAIAESVVRLTDRALRQGMLQGYRYREESSLTLRGRIRFNDQLRQHFGAPLPVEVAYDDYTSDTAENQILHSVLVRMMTVPGVPETTRVKLNRLRHRFNEVSQVRPGAPLPHWQPNRLNIRYQPALRLAELVLRNTSFDLGRGAVPASGFGVQMANVFEDFVTVALAEALRATVGGRAVSQDSGWSLDRDGDVCLRPDLVWYPETRYGPPGLVVDAKYKAEKPQGFPNADIYQILAYCSALGLAHGHLVYAKGNEAERRYFLPGTGPDGNGVVVHVHTLDLDAKPAALLAQVGRLAETMLEAQLPAGQSHAQEHCPCCGK